MHSKLLFVAIVISAAGAFHFGFQLVLTDPAEAAFIEFEKGSINKHYSKILEKSLLKDIWSVTVALFFVGAICGALSINFLAEKLGRKRALIFTYIISYASLFLAILSYFINAFELYAFSRITLGFSNAVSLSIGSLYLSEISPRHLRGRVGMSTGISVQLGLVVGSFVAMPTMLGKEHSWWIIYLGEAALLFVALIIVTFFPESPEFLSNLKKDSEAKNSIIFFHQCSEVEAIEILNELKAQNMMKAKIGVLEIWKKPETRQRAIIAMVAMFGTAFSGVAAINAFAVDILDSAGLSMDISSYVNVGLAIVSFFAALGSSFIVDRFGRRPLLLISYFGIFICNISIGGLLFAHERFESNIISSALILFIALFLTFFAIGPGPLNYFITAELNDLNSRSAAQTWTSFTQMTSRAILLAVFLPLKMALGSAEAYMLLFIAPIAIATIYLYFYLPETKNKTQKELNEELQKRSNGFPGICCSSSSSAVAA